MKRLPDFIIDYNKDQKIMAENIIKDLVNRKIKNNKPAVFFIGGDSGEGKSFAALKMQEVLLQGKSLDLKDYVDYINVHTPLQYPKKLDAILTNKELKKIDIITIHEAREIIKAKLWQSFVSMAVADVNAQVRSVKRMVVIILSQFIRDITPDMRYTITYYCKVYRPVGYKTRLIINVMWKDDRDLQNPKLRKRKVWGYIRIPNGRKKRYYPNFIELSKPSKEVIDIFEKNDRESKLIVIKKKLDGLIKEMEKDAGIEDNKIGAMVDWYTKDQEALMSVGKRSRKKWRVNKEIKRTHGLTDTEFKIFEQKLNEKINKVGQEKDEKQ